MATNAGSLVDRLSNLVQAVPQAPPPPTVIVTSNLNARLAATKNITAASNQRETTAAAKKDWKRVNKQKVNELERRRKEKLSTHIEQLKKLIPTNGILLTTKVAVVEHACNYLKEIQKKLQTLVEDGVTDSVAKELARLRQQVEFYEKERKEYQEILITHGIHPMITGRKRAKVAISKYSQLIPTSDQEVNNTSVSLSGNTGIKQTSCMTSQTSCMTSQTSCMTSQSDIVSMTTTSIKQTNIPLLPVHDVTHACSCVTITTMTSHTTSRICRENNQPADCRVIWSQSWISEKAKNLPNLPMVLTDAVRNQKHNLENKVKQLVQSAANSNGKSTVSVSSVHQLKQMRSKTSGSNNLADGLNAEANGLQTWLRTCSERDKNKTKPTPIIEKLQQPFPNKTKLKQNSSVAQSPEASSRALNSFNIASLMKSQSNLSKSPQSVGSVNLTTVHATQTSDVYPATQKDNFAQSFESDFFDCFQNISSLTAPETPQKQIIDASTNQVQKNLQKTPKDKRLCNSLSLELNDIFRIDSTVQTTEAGKLDQCPSDLENTTITNLLMSPQDTPARHPKQQIQHVEFAPVQRLTHPVSIWQPAITGCNTKTITTSNRTHHGHKQVAQYSTQNAESTTWNHPDKELHNVSRIISAKAHPRFNAGVKRKYNQPTHQEPPTSVGMLNNNHTDQSHKPVHTSMNQHSNPSVDRSIFGHFTNPSVAVVTHVSTLPRHNPEYHQPFNELYNSPSVPEYYHHPTTAGYRFAYNPNISDYPSHPVYIPHLPNANINYNNNNNNTDIKHSRASQHHIRQILS
ncbi:transcription factor protein isoform X2 [Ciona intestinalis]